jgi:ribosomal-protein-alanine N-acetyltransferase
VRYVIDRMTMPDVPRVIEIERLAYPSTWPPSAYRKELQDNRWAHYIVLRDKQIVEERTVVQPQEPERPRKSRLFPLSLLPSRPSVTISSPELASIIGFAGLWLMVDEAHITTIATHPDFRQHGLGEFLLVSLSILRIVLALVGLPSKSVSRTLWLRTSIGNTAFVRLESVVVTIVIIKNML